MAIDPPRSDLGRLVDVVAQLRKTSTSLTAPDERALWSAIHAMAEAKLEQLERRRDRGIE